MLKGQSGNLFWSAADALVLKWVALQIQPQLPVSEHCSHVRGKGVRMSLAEAGEARRDDTWRYVYRTDIKQYYRFINKRQALTHLMNRIRESHITGLLEQWLYYSIEDGGEIFTPERGIARGCSLSPLVGASLLHHMDTNFGGREDIYYARHMDDFLFFTRTRDHLRRVVKQVYEYFDLSGFIPHPDKTQLGRIEKGFDWLGIWFGETETTIAPRAVENHRLRRVQLYERARFSGMTHAEAELRVRAYVKRWNIWAQGMLFAAGH
jgi:hypothetical protein